MIKMPDTFPCEVWVVPSGGYRPKPVMLAKPHIDVWHKEVSHYVDDSRGDVYNIQNLYGTQDEACNASLTAVNTKLVALNKRVAKFNQQIMAIQQIINKPKEQP